MVDAVGNLVKKDEGFRRRVEEIENNLIKRQT
jgi:hypothetical protein